LKNNFLHSFSVSALIIFTMHFLEIAEVFEIVEVEKAEENTEVVAYLQVNNDNCKRRCYQCNPADEGVAISEAANGKSDGKK
jgi:hypothetical protein